MIVPEQDFVFIVDESGISKDRFTVVGGICARRETVTRVYDTLAKYREEHNMKSELKWAKISNQKEAEYRWLVDYFFSLLNSNLLHFHCIIFDSHQWNHRKFNNGDADMGLSKLYYQLILHKFIALCGKEGSLYACVDHRNSTTSLHDLQRMLNAAAARDHGLTTRPLKQLVSKHSHDEDLLQLNDVILGAVCAIRNGKHLLADYRQAKRLIATDILVKSGLGTFDQNSPRDIHRFTVWNMIPQPR